jgi:hypothetical protein
LHPCGLAAHSVVRGETARNEGQPGRNRQASLPAVRLWAWLRSFFSVDEQITIVVDGRSWTDEDGEPFPEDLQELLEGERRPG